MTTAAKAVIDYIEEQNLLRNTEETGSYLRGKLLDLKEKYQIIGDVRGMGLLQALELVEDRRTKVPATAATLQMMEAAKENRIMIGRGGLYGNVLRLSPPMNIGRADVDEFIGRLDASFAKVEATVLFKIRCRMIGDPEIRRGFPDLHSLFSPARRRR